MPTGLLKSWHGVGQDKKLILGNLSKRILPEDSREQFNGNKLDEEQVGQASS